jgi:acetyl-CoA carboxylase biotin carboxyl carrier protein
MTPSTKDKSRLDLPEIQKLIRMIEKSPITVFELEDKDLKIKISKNGGEHSVIQTMMPMPVSGAAPMPILDHAQDSTTAAHRKSIVEIKAPMVGTFYRASSPDADPYVSLGDHVEPIRVLCIIEAMKLMNEVEAEVKGKVVEVCVENAEPVEYNQVLFRIDTSA